MVFAPNEILFYLLLLLLISAITQTSGNMIVESSLYANNDNSSWLFPSGEFAFGFPHLTNIDFFIHYPAPRESKMKITANRGLLLPSSQGVVLWISPGITGVASYGSMYDTGNFVLEENNFNKTILPTQKMERGRVLSSRKSENNFSKGRFQLRFIEGRSKLVFNSINLPTTKPNEAYYEKKSTQLVFDESGYIYILTENEKCINLSRGGLSARNSYVRATLNFDRIFTLYSHPKTTSIGNEIWTSIWSVPNNICKDFLVRADKRPKCECLRGYSFLDPNDPYGSCKPDFTQECTEDEHSYEKKLYAIEEIPNIDWTGIDYIRLRPFTEENCNNSCLQDCMCTVAVFADDDGYWKKKLPLSNGRFDNNFNGKAFIKVMKDNSTLRGPCNPISGKEPIQNKREEKILILVGSVLLGCSVFVKFSLIVSVLYGCFFIYHKKIKTTNEKDATDEFKEQLVKGSFCVVYKGSINMGSNVLVAFKKLNRTSTILVYEFLINGSLACFLFGDLKPNWKERIQIVVRMARALLFLREECSCQIIRCDIKPQDILLDEHYNEWFKNMPITSKVDVYSYGVLLLEIICCWKSVLAMESGGEHNAILIDWAYDCFRDGEINALVEFDVEAMDDMGNVKRFVKVAICCIQEDQSLRPTMRKVTQMLDRVVDVPIPPCPSPFITTTTT
ncbi:hypothetical protein CIPAW_13G167500 [Carya illinoinensis]|uniref:Uncharacterized protein n=1 Tax=Carya illinoinensis TaxID=32201 RepID=A0A8T1NUN3_CARIL|nr:hypothetical protein CIPAW_13G167500 [Carya illinoinensis]